MLSHSLNNVTLEYLKKIMQWERMILKTSSEKLSRQEKNKINCWFIYLYLMLASHQNVTMKENLENILENIRVQQVLHLYLLILSCFYVHHLLVFVINT